MDNMDKISRDTFKLTNSLFKQFGGDVDNPMRYTGVRLQQGVPLVDADWNELEDIRKYEHRNLIKTLVGNGVPAGSDELTGNDGFAISPTNPSTSDFIIKKGVCYVEGWTVINPANINYTEQELYKEPDKCEKWKVNPLLRINSIPTGKYWIFLDVWERTIEGEEDSRIKNPDIGMETCMRLKQEWVVRMEMAQDNVKPEVKKKEDGHVYYLLSTIDAVAGCAIDDPKKIIDARRKGVAVLDGENTQMKNGSITAKKLAPEAVAFQNISFGYKEWKLEEMKAEKEDSITCVVDFPTAKLVMGGNGTIADNMKPVFWAVYPLEENLRICNYYCQPQELMANTVTWYPWVEYFPINLVRPPYNPKSHFENHLFIYNGYNRPISVKVVCWWF